MTSIDRRSALRAGAGAAIAGALASGCTDDGPDTVAALPALPALLADLDRRGLRAVTTTELLS
ncbi:hypothetical protein [Streptomyces lunaelactis]|uniref:hypothetical protein n=1 Tax=Streptomyces lunaelactis TaxID=1535768 RepID=UPI00352AF200